MDLKEFTEVLYKTEQNNDVNQFQRLGIELWPLYRNQTISIFRNKEAYYSKTKKINQSNNNLKSVLQKNYYKYIRYHSIVNHIQNQISNLKPEVFLYSKNATHSDKIEDCWYDKFVDPYYELLKDKTLVCKIELKLSNDIEKTNRTVNTTIIDLGLFEDYFLHTNKNNKALNLFEITEQINKITQLNFLNDTVSYVFKEIIKFKEIFLIILKKLKPKYVFIKCYYEQDSFGLVLAANELGIKTIDIQHGKQGVYHPMYSHFSKIPENGYKLLPKVFWNWGDESKNNIEKWQNNRHVHQAIVGGNLWMSKWKYSDVYKPSLKSEIEFIYSLKKYNRIVLYSTQPIKEEGIFPKHIIETIKNSPKNWCWLIRIHPFQKLSAEEIFSELGGHLSNVEVEFSTKLPLYFLLKNVTHHVALWSSTCFEANEFEVPTIIAHEFGYKLYDNFISSNGFFYSIQSSQIIEIIESDSKNSFINYIETSNKSFNDAFNNIGILTNAIVNW